MYLVESLTTSRFMASSNSLFPEGNSIHRPPIFNGEGYHYWKTRMQIFIEAIDLNIWEAIEIGPYIPTIVDASPSTTTQKPRDKWTAFGYAVIKSIIHRKQVENHAWWLISTVFIIMMPALARGIQNVYVKWHIQDMPNVDIMAPVYFCQGLIILMILLAAWKYQKLGHIATWIAIGVNLFNMLLEPLGRSEAIQEFLKSFVKG